MSDITRVSQMDYVSFLLKRLFQYLFHLLYFSTVNKLDPPS